MKCKIIISILLLNVLVVASDTSSIKWKWEGYNMFNLEFLSQKAVDHKDETGFSDVDFGSFYIQFPIIMKKDKPIYFGAGLTYNQYRFNYSGLDELDGEVKNSGEEVAHSLRAVVGFNYRFAKKSHIYWEYNGGVDGWWQSVDSKSFNHLLFAYFGNRFRKNIYFRAGIIGSYDFGDLSIYPLFGFSIGFNDHLAFEALFPSHVIFRVKINDRFETGVKLSLLIKDVGVNFINSDVKLSFQQLNTGLYVDGRIIKSVIARAEGGVVLMRSISLYNRDESLFLDAQPAITPYFKFTIRWAV